MAKESDPQKKESKKAQSMYWKSLLADCAPSSKIWLEGLDVSSLKTAHPHYRTMTLSIKSALQLAIKHFAAVEKLDVLTILQGAFGLLLNRYSSLPNIIYGSAIRDNKKTLAFYNPIIPIRSLVTPHKSVKQYLCELEKQLSDNHKHAHELLTEEYLHNINYLFLLPNRKIQQKNQLVSSNPTQFHLLFVLKQQKPLKFQVFYNETQFASNHVKNLLDHFQHILEEIVHSPAKKISELPMLTAAEYTQIIQDWSKPIAPLTAEQLQCAHIFFSTYATLAPDSLAVAYGPQSLRYGELEKLSTQLAHLLLSKNIRRGDTVAVLMERTPALLVTLLAIFKIGAIYVPVNPKYPDERIDFVLSDCRAKAVLVNNTNRLPEKFLSIAMIIDDFFSTLNAYPSTPVNISVSLEDIAYIIYTSGTTGIPKGVMLKQAGLTNLIHWYQTRFSVNATDRSSQFASQGFDTFFCETIPFLASGASIHIVDDSVKLTPAVLIPWLVENRITICDLPTAYAQILLTLPWPDTLSLHTLKIGGESVTHYPNQRFPFDIWNGYGPTESTVETSYMKFYQAYTLPADQPCKHMPPPIGKPITNTEIYVVDQYLQPVPVGVAGELLIGGMGLAAGYINRDDLTQEKFITHPFNPASKAKLYRTGDLGRWLTDGTLEYIGRIDNQIKIRGYRIELSEIETALAQYPDVSEVLVIAKSSGEHKSLLAYLVPNLDKIRIPYQEKCLLTLNEIKFIEIITEDISKAGVAITGLTEQLPYNKTLRLHFRLPGMNEAHWMTGELIWQQDQRAGIRFDPTTKQMSNLQKSIEYYLLNNNLMETLQGAAAKRNLRKALKNKLPDYMIPSVVSMLPKFPLTINGKIDVNALPAPNETDRYLERSYIEPQTVTERRIATIWEDLLKQKHVSLTDNFFDIGGNSLLVSHLTLRLLEVFNMSIPAKILFDLPFIAVLAEYIDSHGQHYTHQSAVQDEIKHDVILSDDIVPFKKSNPNLHNPRSILLTGAGGFLGIYMLRELLRHTDTKIYCLIRKGEFETAAKRLVDTINKFQLDDEISLANRRIVIITGDISFDKFGISSAQYASLAEKVDVIFHCGAQVNTMASYTTLRNSNVQGTLEIIKFATQTINKSIHYISTLSSAYLLNEDGNFIEEFPDKEDPNLVGGYAITKWVSERLLTEIKNRGLPVSIYRSGYIMGQSDTGIANLNDALLLLIKGCIQLGFAPTWDDIIAILPVDFVSKVIVLTALTYPHLSKVYHLDHPIGIMWTDLIAWLNHYGYHIQLCEHAEWQKHLMQIEEDNALYPFLPNYLAEKTHPKTPGTAMENSEAVLTHLELDYPDIDDQLLRIYMNYLLTIGFLPTPEASTLATKDSSYEPYP